MTKMNIKNALAKIGVTDKKQTEFMAAFEGKSLADISVNNDNGDVWALSRSIVKGSGFP